MTDQPARVTPAEISALLDHARQLAPDTPLDEQIAYHQRKASLLSRVAADLDTAEAHVVAAGNAFAAASGAGIKDLMARMGHDSERAAMIYLHEMRGADRAITRAIDAHVDAERERHDDDRPAR